MSMLSDDLLLSWWSLAAVSLSMFLGPELGRIPWSSLCKFVASVFIVSALRPSVASGVCYLNGGIESVGWRMYSNKGTWQVTPLLVYRRCALLTTHAKCYEAAAVEQGEQWEVQEAEKRATWKVAPLTRAQLRGTPLRSI